MVTDVLRHTGLPAEALDLEITESLLMGESDRLMPVFNELTGLGARFSIDDFGTGYSSLMNLKHLPFNEIKVDRSFTSEMLANEHDAAIVRSTIDLGHELGRSIVAEGVETREALERLRNYRCDFAQGYFISPPLEKSALREWLLDPPVFSTLG